MENSNLKVFINETTFVELNEKQQKEYFKLCATRDWFKANNEIELEKWMKEKIEELRITLTKQFENSLK